MKKLIFSTVLFCLLLTSCSTATPTGTKQKMRCKTAILSLLLLFSFTSCKPMQYQTSVRKLVVTEVTTTKKGTQLIRTKQVQDWEPVKQTSVKVGDTLTAIRITKL